MTIETSRALIEEGASQPALAKRVSGEAARSSAGDTGRGEMWLVPTTSDARGPEPRDVGGPRPRPLGARTSRSRRLRRAASARATPESEIDTRPEPTAGASSESRDDL